MYFITKAVQKGQFLISLDRVGGLEAGDMLLINDADLTTGETVTISSVVSSDSVRPACDYCFDERIACSANIWVLLFRCVFVT